MDDVVEVYSATDAPHLPDRDVRYWVEFRGRKSAKLTEWTTVNAWAQALCAEHGVAIVDRSDKASGLLRAMLGR